MVMLLQSYDVVLSSATLYAKLTKLQLKLVNLRVMVVTLLIY